MSFISYLGFSFHQNKYFITYDGVSIKIIIILYLLRNISFLSLFDSLSSRSVYKVENFLIKDFHKI